MAIRHRVGAAFIALALAGAWALPAPAAEPTASGTEVTAPAAEPAVSPAPKAVRTATVKKKAVRTKVRTAKKFWRHRPIRLASADWPVRSSYHSGVSYLVLGVGF